MNIPATASIILASRNEGAMLKRTLDSMQKASCQLPYEIIVVDDGSTDASVSSLPSSSALSVRTLHTPGLGIAPARNAGARIASGEMLVFCDAHITVSDGWLDAMAQALADHHCDAVTPGIAPLAPDQFIPLYKIAASAPLRTVGCGRVFATLISNTWLHEHVNPRECPILSGGCFAVRHDVWKKIGGYEESFRGYGYDEEEISLKLWLFGYRLMTVPEVVILHQFRPAAPYQIASRDMMHNRMYAALCHFSDERTERMLNNLRNDPAFAQTAQEVFSPGNLKGKREVYRAARTHDDDWYFQKFSPHL